MSVDEFAAAVGIGRNTAYQLINGNVVQHVRVGRKILVTKAAVAEFLGA